MARAASRIDRDKIYEDLKKIVSRGNSGHFIEDFMEAYYFSSASIAKIKKGIEKTPVNGCFVLKKSFYFQEVPQGQSVEKFFLDSQNKSAPTERFVIATDYKQFIARDNNTKMSISISFNELADHYEFFLPFCGIEKHQDEVENVADRKAAEKMAELFDVIKNDNLDNPEWNLTDKNTPREKRKRIEHNFALFFTRILFCLFADDTRIFEDNQFQNALQLYTDEDGKNMGFWLEGLFEVLDLPTNQRFGTNQSYKRFPYVNGGLFKDRIPVPRFTYKSRKKLIECGNNDWSQINPDIFGSMFQGVISPEQRSELGQHYTSVSNIMKVIRPLFLDDLHEELNSIKGNDKKLDAFREKLSKIKIFDPACGSGNFLIIAYKELCRLEMEAWDSYIKTPLPFLSIKLENFFGIEIDEFPCEVARLSLWFAQHQINLECYDKYGNCNPTLPLTPSGNITCGNACRLDWNAICELKEGEQVFICSNPPFIGGNLMEEWHRKDKEMLFPSMKEKGVLDYVACWYAQAAKYLRKHRTTQCAFVSTNSICQGRQIVLWPEVLSEDLEIFFAYESFKWKNNATNNAGVTVVIIGIRSKSSKPKFIYTDSLKKAVQNINYYLSEFELSCIVTESRKCLTKNIPEISFGSMPNDGGNLLLSEEEYNEIPVEDRKFCKIFIGADEFLKGYKRFCLWIDDSNISEAKKRDWINRRIQKTKESRLSSNRQATKRLAMIPWAFGEIRYFNSSSILIPEVSSENRKYIPIGFVSPDIVISNRAFSIANAPLWLFSILTSEMHMAWTKTICGRLETRFNYSANICYNTFPFPSVNDSQKKQLETTARSILMAREIHYDLNLAQQYDPEKMPEDLREAHKANDLLVDSLYIKSGFSNDDERLAELFKRYKKLVEEAK